MEEVPPLMRYEWGGYMGPMFLSICSNCKKVNPSVDCGLIDPVERQKVANQKFYWTCGRCHRTGYCSKSFQKTHWRQHKSQCHENCKQNAKIFDTSDTQVMKDWIFISTGSRKLCFMVKLQESLCMLSLV